MRSKIEYFLSNLDTKIDVSNYVDVNNIDLVNPFDSICKMIEEIDGFDINEFYELEDEINDFFEILEEEKKENKNPRAGQFVYDVYSCKKRKVQAISGKLYFIGSEQEPVFRDEFIFPLPKQNKKTKH